MSAAEKTIETEGKILVALGGMRFRVQLINSEHQVLATIAGKMRQRYVRLTAGDRVRLEMSPYDVTKARITWRLS